MALEPPIRALHSVAMYARDAASIATPIGLVRVTGSADRIDAIEILVSGEATSSNTPAIREALRQLDAYFAGRLTAFDLPLAPSPTERGAVLRQGIVDIAYGETASYGALAKAIGSSPRAIAKHARATRFRSSSPVTGSLEPAGRLVHIPRATARSPNPGYSITSGR
jgi:methylated-DNA-[protein]-cysteine S-methyltransferase